MDRKELEARTKRFAIAVIRFVSRFERTTASRVIGYQLLKSGTSIGANYREANRAQSRRDFAHKISLAEKEASETRYWLEICEELPLGIRDGSMDLLGESGELLAIFTSIGRSIRAPGSEQNENRDPRVSEDVLVTYDAVGVAWDGDQPALRDSKNGEWDEG